MTTATRMRPLLTAVHRYDKSLSTRGRDRGRIIEAPILAYLIETKNGRILYDVGCDYQKIADPALRAQYYSTETFPFGAPEMHEEDRLPHHLSRLGLTPADVDIVFLGHLHFAHAGGLDEVRGAEIHVQASELNAACSGRDVACFADDFAGTFRWKVTHGEYDLCPGVHAVSSPGHTAGHMSLFIELPKGAPIILCGDAADLQENLREEVAPGICWEDRVDEALASIRKLKRIAREERATAWPNHDMAFWRQTRGWTHGA